MRTLTALLFLSLVAALPATAAETDNYWAWLDPPRDSTHLLQRHMARELGGALAEVNASSGGATMQCHEVIDHLLQPFSYSGLWFFVGTMDRWGLQYTPRTNRQYLEEYLPRSIYRYADRPLPGAAIPLDPTTSVVGVHVGFDKFGHFLLNGRRYYERYRLARERGLSEEQAMVDAIELGITQESSILGMTVSRVFSYADLEANFQGLELFRWLCDGDRPALAQDDDGQWVLREPLVLERFVNPCWDESFLPNAYDPRTAPGVTRALFEQCPLLQTTRVKELRADYRARGCKSFSHQYVMNLVEEGKLPDPRPFDIESVCRVNAPR